SVAAAAAVTVTVACCVIPTPLIVAETTFAPAPVDLSVPVNTPLPFVVPPAVSVFPVPVAESATVAPLIRFPFASFAVTVMVLALVPELAGIVVGAAPVPRARRAVGGGPPHRRLPGAPRPRRARRRERHRTAAQGPGGGDQGVGPGGGPECPAADGGDPGARRGYGVRPRSTAPTSGDGERHAYPRHRV